MENLAWLTKVQENRVVVSSCVESTGKMEIFYCARRTRCSQSHMHVHHCRNGESLSREATPYHRHWEPRKELSPPREWLKTTYTDTQPSRKIRTSAVNQGHIQWTHLPCFGFPMCMRCVWGVKHSHQHSVMWARRTWLIWERDCSVRRGAGQKWSHVFLVSCLGRTNTYRCRWGLMGHCSCVPESPHYPSRLALPQLSLWTFPKPTEGTT